jgi:hypothetical protein
MRKANQTHRSAVGFRLALHFHYHLHTDSESRSPYRAHARKENLCPFPELISLTKLSDTTLPPPRFRQMYQNEGTNPFGDTVVIIFEMTEQTQFRGHACLCHTRASGYPDLPYVDSPVRGNDKMAENYKANFTQTKPKTMGNVSQRRTPVDCIEEKTTYAFWSAEPSS